MKKIFLITAVISSVIIALVACTDGSAKFDGPVVISQDSMIKRGSYLVNAIGCDDCHSPKTVGPNGFELIMDQRFGGHPATVPTGKIDKNVMNNGWMMFTMDLTSAVGPWGQSFSANISSDATGIGNWTEAQFIKALREGKYKGMDETRPLLPPMPWFVYKNMSDLDLKSIFAFLKSTKPVKNVVPAPKQFKDL